jgi:uncharacterized protein YggT (Ycf19 family)
MGDVSQPADRPRQVAVGAVMAGVGSLLLVMSLFDTMGATHSAEMHASLQQFLSKPPGDGLGVTVDQMLSLVRTLVLVTGGLAAAAAVLAGYAFWRHRGAWIGLSVTAVLLLVTGSVVGNPLPMVVLVGAAALWSRPARDWFAGRVPEPSAAGLTDSVGSMSQGARAVTSKPPDAVDRPVAPAPAQRAGVDPEWPAPAPPAAVAPTAPPATPRAVLAAAWLTWACAGLTAVFFVAVVGVLLADEQAVLDAVRGNPQFERLDMTTTDLVAALWVASALVVGWALAAIACAAFAVRRQRWARSLLVISAVLAVPLSLVAFPLGLIDAAAEVATLVLLFTGRASAWYAGADRAGHDRRRAAKPPSNVW